MAAQVVVPDEGFAAPLVVTNERSLAEREENNASVLLSFRDLKHPVSGAGFREGLSKARPGCVARSYTMRMPQLCNTVTAGFAP